jgi:hypothetical protein
VSGGWNGAAASRQANQLIKGFGSRLAGKTRGPDHGEGRRVPRRNSYDVDDKRAQPWKKVGDGSHVQGVIHREALMQTAKEQRRQDWHDLPNQKLREIREQRELLAAELERLMADGRAPIGRPATLRQQIEKLDATMEKADGRLRRVDLNVLEALLDKIDFATGQLFPSYDTIADWAVCSRNAAIGALKRLKSRGFIDWVRRSIRTANEGEFAPQREQTSNAYFFDHRRSLPRGTFQRYWKILVSKLRRLGAVPPAVTNGPGAPPRAAQPVNAELREALAGLSSSVVNAST